MRRSAIADLLLGLPRPQKRLIALGIDSLLCISTVWASLYLRLGEWTLIRGNQWLLIVVSLGLAIPIFIKAGLYRAIFRHTGWPAMVAVVRACLVYGVAYAVIFTFISFEGVPRTVGLIQPVLLFLMIAASRALAHHLLGGDYRQIVEQECSKMLIYGAGASGRQLATALAQSREIEVVGFIDDDASLQGASWHGLAIYNPNEILDIVARYEVTDVLLAVPSATRRRRGEILELLRPAGVNVRTLPGLLDLAKGRFEISEMRSLEIEDLLGRDAVAPDKKLLEKNITGRVVLVTGGGGSIGGELCRQILDLRPNALVVVDSSEYALYAIHQELESRRQEASLHGVALIPILASVQDEARMRAVLNEWRPETIYHAAAYKHVPLVEHNPVEGIKNNVLGTLTTARLALENKVKDFVLISTDKAVRPTNIMGASKRLAELILQAFACTSEETRFSIVRFGNVLGSSGSVVPLFRQQISRGGPVTVTHPEVTRYFMTIPEAAQLVIQAGAMSSGGEVFVLDMGEPVRVIELARNMIELSGMKVRDQASPDGDIEIVIIGLRPGEKL